MDAKKTLGPRLLDREVRDRGLSGGNHVIEEREDHCKSLFSLLDGNLKDSNSKASRLSGLLGTSPSCSYYQDGLLGKCPTSVRDYSHVVYACQFTR